MLIKYTHALTSHLKENHSKKNIISTCCIISYILLPVLQCVTPLRNSNVDVFYISHINLLHLGLSPNDPNTSKYIAIKWCETSYFLEHGILVGGLEHVFIFPIFPIYGVANHPNWLSYFWEGWPNHQPEIFPADDQTCPRSFQEISHDFGWYIYSTIHCAYAFLKAKTPQNI